MNGFLRFVEKDLQWAALGFMVLMCILRIRWFLRFPAEQERQAPTAPPGTSFTKGIIYSWAAIAMPWAMESIRKKLFGYTQCVIFHLAILFSIGLAFLIPYAPGLWGSSFLKQLLSILFSLGVGVGIYRIFRRFHNPVLRLLSTPDDIFSVFFLTLWLFLALLVVFHLPDQKKWLQLFYFLLTAFLFVYVPFSKISHFLFYFFTRYYFGRSMIPRGVFPVKHGPQVKPIRSLSKED